MSSRAVARRGTAAAVQLATRTALTRLLALGGTLVLARLLAPADFGVYAFVWFAMVIVLAVGDGGASAALVQRPAEPSRRELGTALTVQLAIGGLGFVALWLLAPVAAALLPERADAADMLRLLALALPLVASRALATAMLERRLRFGPIAIGEVAGQAAFYGVAIPLALSGAGAWSLVLGGLAHSIVQTLIILAAYGRLPRPALDLHALTSMVRFGGLYQSATLTTWIRDAAVPFVGTVIGGATVGGYLQFSWRIGQLLGSGEEIIGRVAFPAFARLRDDRAALHRAVGTTARLGILISMPAAAWVIAGAPIAVPLVFGSAWAPAAIVVQLVAIGTLVRSPARVVRQAFFALGDAGRGAGIAAAGLAATLVPIVLLLPSGGAVGAGIAFAVGSGLTALIVLGGGRESVRVAPWDVLRLGAEAAVLAALAWLPVMFVGGWAGLVISALLVAVAWAAIVFAFERSDLEAVRALRRPDAAGFTLADPEPEGLAPG
jgi:PST family polysaccharide transporter